VSGLQNGDPGKLEDLPGMRPAPDVCDLQPAHSRRESECPHAATTKREGRRTPASTSNRSQHGICLRAGRDVFKWGSLRRRLGQRIAAAEVRIESFYLARYVVTKTRGRRYWGRILPCSQRGMYPAEQVTWADVNEFIRRLNGLTSGESPFASSEAEWEYAARSGVGRNSTPEGRHQASGWYSENSQGSTQPWGSRRPTAWTMRHERQRLGMVPRHLHSRCRCGVRPGPAGGEERDP